MGYDGKKLGTRTGGELSNQRHGSLGRNKLASVCSCVWQGLIGWVVRRGRHGDSLACIMCACT